MYEQLSRHIEGSHKSIAHAGDMFMSMVSRIMLYRLTKDEGRQLKVEHLEEVFFRHSIFFRQVTLTGMWWRLTTGRILAFLAEDDTPVILTPGYASYSFVNPHTGQRISVTSHKSQTDTTLLKPEVFTLTQPWPAGPLTMRRLRRFAWHSLSRADLWAVFLVCLSVVLLTMFTPYVTKIVFREVVPSGDKSQLLPVAVLLFSATIGLAMVHVTCSLVVFRLKDKLEYALQTALMARLLHLPATFFRQWQAGDLSSRVLSLSRFIGMLTENLLFTMLSTIFSAVLFFQFFIYGGLLLFIGIGTLFN